MLPGDERIRKSGSDRRIEILFYTDRYERRPGDDMSDDLIQIPTGVSDCNVCSGSGVIGEFGVGTVDLSYRPCRACCGTGGIFYGVSV